MDKMNEKGLEKTVDRVVIRQLYLGTESPVFR